MRMMPIRENNKGLAQINFVVLNEEWAQKNHGQSLARLAERGGLKICEAAAIMERRPWRGMTDLSAMRVIRKRAEEILQNNNDEGVV